MHATLQVLNPDDRRGWDERTTVASASTLRDDGGVPHQVVVDDISAGGFRFSAALHLDAGTPVRLGLSGAGVASGRVVWRRGDEHGCVFDRALTAADLDAAFTAAGTVVDRFPQSSAPAQPDPVIQPWGRSVRVGVAFASGALAWAGVLAVVKALI